MAERIPCPCGDQTRPGHPLSWCALGRETARRELRPEAGDPWEPTLEDAEALAEFVDESEDLGDVLMSMLEWWSRRLRTRLQTHPTHTDPGTRTVTPTNLQHTAAWLTGTYDWPGTSEQAEVVVEQIAAHLGVQVTDPSEEGEDHAE